MWLKDKVAKMNEVYIFLFYYFIASLTLGFDMNVWNFMHEVLIKPLMLTINFH